MQDESAWVPAWGQAMTDFRGEDDEPGFADVTVRMTVPASIGGGRVRIELSNQFGSEAVRIGHAAVGSAGRFVELAFDGHASALIPAGAALWTDPAELAVEHGADIIVDLYLPEPTAYATANGFRFDRSLPGDFVAAHPFPLEGSAPAPADAAQIDAAREFPATNTDAAREPGPEPDGSGWSLPSGGPFLRTIELEVAAPRAVVVALGGSSTAMGWPQYTAALLPAEARVAVVNRGIAGNRIRLDAPAGTPSWGRAGLARFDDDVLGTRGATHLVIAYNSNDWGLPGRVTSSAEMPTVEQVIAGYRALIERAEAAGIAVTLATVTPLAPEMSTDPEREGIRLAVNEWIRTEGHELVDFDAAIRSPLDPARLADAYAAPDRTHPSVAGSKRLARAVADVVDGWPLAPLDERAAAAYPAELAQGE